jgi:hypothetical protein
MSTQQTRSAMVEMRFQILKFDEKHGLTLVCGDINAQQLEHLFIN